MVTIAPTKILEAECLLNEKAKVLHRVETFPWGVIHKTIMFKSINAPFDKCRVTRMRKYKKDAQTEAQQEEIIKHIEKTYKTKFNRV